MVFTWDPEWNIPEMKFRFFMKKIKKILVTLLVFIVGEIKSIFPLWSYLLIKKCLCCAMIISGTNHGTIAAILAYFTFWEK